MAQKNEQERLITINSDVLNANLRGNFSFKEVGNYVTYLLSTHIPSESSVVQNRPTYNLPTDITFEINFNHTEILSKVFFKDLRISKNTRFKGGYSKEQDKLKNLQ